jgi:hypothetical protein
MSSAFSGIGAPEVASSMFASAMNSMIFIGDPPSDHFEIESLWCCEIDSPCQEELLAGVSGPPPKHLFGDVLSVFPQR